MTDAQFVNINDPDVLEHIVVGTLRELRDINEPVVRQQWRTTEGENIQARLMKLLGNNGPEYHIIMNTIRMVNNAHS